MRPPPSVTDTAPAGSTTLHLGPRLRPIIFGGSPGAPYVFAGGDVDTPPRHVLGVHSRTDSLLGYVVIDRAAAARSIGGLTLAHDLDLEDVVQLASAATLQVRFLGLAAGACHGLVLVEEKTAGGRLRDRLEDFTDALRPLVSAGLCAITYTVHGTRLEPRLAREGLAASTAAAAVSVLRHLGIAQGRATVAVDRPSLAERECLPALAERGLRVVAEGGGALTARADVLIVSRPHWTLDEVAASAIQARSIVTTGRASLTAAVERNLDERRILFVPGTVAGGGILLALDLRSRGLDERTTIVRTFAAVEERAAAVLQAAASSGRPLSAQLHEIAI